MRPERRQPLILLGLAIVAGAMILAVAFNLDRDVAPETPARERPRDVDLDPGAPEALGGAEDEPRRTTGSRGWIQIADDAGRLAQQYRCANLDPDPEGRGEGWLGMTEPELEIYRPDGSVVRLTGAEALVRAPGGAIESGSVSGAVVVRAYDSLDAARSGDPARGTFELRTESAQFDGIIGEIRCTGAVHVQTREGEFFGRGLRLLVSDAGDGLQALRIEEVDHVRLVVGAEVDAASGAGPPNGTGDALHLVFSSRTEGLGGAPVPSGDDEDAAADPDEPFYRLTLRDDVRLERGRGPDPAGVERTIAPPPSDGDVIVTCAAGLTVDPATPDERLDSARDGLLRLVGAPVRLTDPAAATVARGAEVRYGTRRGMIELVGSAAHPMTIEGPEMRLEAERIAATRAEGIGAIGGSGMLTLLDRSDDGAEPIERLRATWSERVDLVFSGAAEDATGDDLLAGLGSLRRAIFRGSARLETPGAAGGGNMLGGDAVDDAGRLRGDLIAIDFAETEAERPEPRRVEARGAVAVEGGSRRLWADELDADLAADPTSGDLAVAAVVARGAVQLRLEKGERIFADQLDVRAEERIAVLSGGDAPVLLVDGPNLVDTPERVVVDDRTGRSRVEGRGRFWRFDAPILADADPDAPVAAPAPDALAGAFAEELRVRWSEGVEITPDGDAAAEPGSAPRLVRFLGDVRVRSPELRVDGADVLAVRIAAPDGDDATPAIESIEAEGAIVARSVGQPGTMRGGRLAVAMTVDAAGNVVPASLEIRDAVELDDGASRLWADVLRTTFRPRPPDADDAIADDAGAEPAATGSLAAARVEIDRVEADGDVQIRLEGGERVFADRLRAEAQARRARLEGGPVLFAGRDFLLTGPEAVEIDEARGEHRLEGGGRFRSLLRAIEPPPAEERADRTALMLALDGGDAALEARWSRSARVRIGALLAAAAPSSAYDVNRLRAIELAGDVHVASTPTPEEEDTIDADVLALDFLAAADPDVADGPLPASNPSRGAELMALRALDTARLESRVWTDAAREGAPRVFYVAGDDLFYDQRRLEARVVGRGELLLREAAPEEAPADASPAGFARGGTSLFRWRDELTMRRVVEERFDIEMRGEVRCIHRDAGDRMSRLDASLVTTSVDRGGASAEPTLDAAGRFDLGGPVELRRVVGRGGVYIETPERGVACDAFDYNLGTGLAELAAERGRRVSILNRNAAQPITAERVLWDMRDDTITIRRAGG